MGQRTPSRRRSLGRMDPNALRRWLTRPEAPRQDFTEDLKRAVWKRQRGTCWISGRQISHTHHVAGRGHGGERRFNHPANLLGVHAHVHMQLERQVRPWLRIAWYDPDDREGGLEVERYDHDRGLWERVPHHRLWFYRQPRPM